MLSLRCSKMPHFYFHVYNDDVTHDDEGIELPDRQAALAVARKAARTLAAESITEHGHLLLFHRIEIIVDDVHIDTVYFRDVVIVRDEG